MNQCRALIPARDGSKGNPRKNIGLIGNKPLITWRINAARESDLIFQGLVSTEEPEIETCAYKYSVEIPCNLPQILQKIFLKQLIQ